MMSKIPGPVFEHFANSPEPSLVVVVVKQTIFLGHFLFCRDVPSKQEEEEHHLEADDAGFNNWVLSLDWRMQLPFDESATLSTSVATGENGFGRDSWAYGVGLEKIWGAHAHGDGPEFCPGAVKLRTEFIGRNIGVLTGPAKANDISHLADVILNSIAEIPAFLDREKP